MCAISSCISHLTWRRPKDDSHKIRRKRGGERKPSLSLSIPKEKSEGKELRPPVRAVGKDAHGGLLFSLIRQEALQGATSIYLKGRTATQVSFRGTTRVPPNRRHGFGCASTDIAPRGVTRELRVILHDSRRQRTNTRAYSVDAGCTRAYVLR